MPVHREHHKHSPWAIVRMARALFGELHDAYVTLTMPRPGYDRLCLWLCLLCSLSGQFAGTELYSECFALNSSSNYFPLQTSTVRIYVTILAFQPINTAAFSCREQLHVSSSNKAIKSFRFCRSDRHAYSDVYFQDLVAYS